MTPHRSPPSSLSRRYSSRCARTGASASDNSEMCHSARGTATVPVILIALQGSGNCAVTHPCFHTRLS